eukprot:1161227-Pelagomonas_calceolata.AAC.3
MGIWRVAGSTRLQNLAVRSITIFHSTILRKAMFFCFFLLAGSGNAALKSSSQCLMLLSVRVAGSCLFPLEVPLTSNFAAFLFAICTWSERFRSMLSGIAACMLYDLFVYDLVPSRSLTSTGNSPGSSS